MTIHPVDQIVATNPEAARVLALEPVRCTDCGQYVPLGWVEFGTVKCPKNIGANGTQYGHRVDRDVITNIKDSFYNNLAVAGLVEKIASAKIVRLAGKRGYGYVLSNALTKEIVEASPANVYNTRGAAVEEASNRARFHGFERMEPIDDKTTQFFSADQFESFVKKSEA